VSDLTCNKCGHFAEKVNIDWFDGYSWCEVTVYCEDCEAETVWDFREPHPKEVHEV